MCNCAECKEYAAQVNESSTKDHCKSPVDPYVIGGQDSLPKEFPHMVTTTLNITVCVCKCIQGEADHPLRARC